MSPACAAGPFGEECAVSLGFLVNELVLRDDHRHLYFWFPFFNILMTIRLIEVYTEVANRITCRPFLSS